MTHFDGRYYITEIDGAQGIKSFIVNDNVVEDICTHYFLDGHTNESEIRKKEKFL